MKITISVTEQQAEKLREMGASSFVQKCLALAEQGEIFALNETERRDIVSALYMMAQSIGTEEQINRWIETARKLQ